MVEVKGLVKKYGGKTILKNVSFKVNDGEIVGFLGPNGAGKSTTMNIISGYIAPTNGSVTINGHDILKDTLKAKSEIGYLPEQPPLYLDMTVKAYLGFIFDLKKVKLNKKEHIKEVCELVGINDVYNRTIKKLSKGYKQRVGIAQALIGDPPVIILDEPTVGLDPNQMICIRNLIKELSKNHTVILSSHILSEIQSVCQRIIVINQGEIVADGKTNDVVNISDVMSKLILQVDGDNTLVKKIISNIAGIKTVSDGANKGDNLFEYEVEYLSNLDVRRELFRELAKNDCPIIEINNIENSLEDVFLKLTSGENPEKVNTSKKEKKSSNEEE